MNNGHEQKCVNCKWCELTPESATSGEGFCHLRPPQTVIMMGPRGPAPMIVKHLVRLTEYWCAAFEVQLVRPATQAPMDPLKFPGK